MKKIVKISDTITTDDSLHLNGESIKTGLDTRIIVTANNCRKPGQTIEVLHNKTVLPGRVKLIESVFPVEPNMSQHIFLNDNVTGLFDPTTLDMTNIDPSLVKTVIGNAPSNLWPRSNPTLFRRRNVRYWCAGRGAANNTNIGTSWPSQIINTKLYDMIPFRYVPDDSLLPDNEARKYKFKVKFDNGYVGYYFKKIEFDNLAGINMTADGSVYIPKWGDTQPNIDSPNVSNLTSFKGNKIQSNYIDMSLKVEPKEFKEWFTANDGTVENANINEIGLILGLEAYYSNDEGFRVFEDISTDEENYSVKELTSEVYDAELFAHLTFDPYPVSRENASIDFSYRIYS